MKKENTFTKAIIQHPGKGIALGTAATITGILLLPAAMAWIFLHPPRRRHQHTPFSAHRIAFERIQLRSADGVRLAAWFVPPPTDRSVRGVVIICHGYFGHRGTMLPHLRFLHEAGYAAVLFDFRAHGWSGGMRTTFGVTESQDLTAAVDWVSNHSELSNLPLAVVSESMGAAVTLMVAAEDPRIQAVVSDSAFSRFDGAIQTRLTSLFGEQFASITAPPAQRIGERILGRACRDIAPVEAIARIAPRPVFLIQGTADEVVPPRSLHELYAAADPETTQKWVVEGARHVQSVHQVREEYARRVLEFLDSNLPTSKS